ncbi:hypothetical protein ACM66B_002555 [Microbotryomycetes sp. NB124-2]
MAVLVSLLKIIIVVELTRSTFKAIAAARHYHNKLQEPSRSTTSRLKRKLRLELQHWVVFVCLSGVEKLCDKFISWLVPFYSQIKLVCWLLAGTTLGSQLVYNKIIAPTVKPYESTLDMLGALASTIIVALLACVLFGPRKLSEWWTQRSGGSRVTSSDQVPAILQGLRSAQEPKLAHRLADSIETAHAKLNTDVSTRLAKPILADRKRYQGTRVTTAEQTALGRAVQAEAHSIPAPEPSPPRHTRESRTPRQSLYPEVAALPPIVKIDTPPAPAVTPAFGQHARRQSSSAKGKGRASQHDELAAVTTSTPPALVLANSHQAELDSWTEADLGQLTASTNTPTASLPPTATPAPPGAFRVQSVAPKSPDRVGPSAVPARLSEIGSSGALQAQNSPRQQASRAIAGLAAELDDTRGLSGWVNGSTTTNKSRRTQSSRLRNVEDDSEDEDLVGASPRSKRLTTTKTKTGKKPRLSGHSTLEEILQQSKAEEGARKSPAKRRRRASSGEDEGDDDDDDEYVNKETTVKSTAASRRKAVATSRSGIPAVASKSTTSRLRASTSTRDVKAGRPIASAGPPRSRSTATLATTTSRVPVPKSTKAASSRLESLTAGSSSSSDDEMSVPAKSIVSSSKQAGALVANGKPPRKARRLVGSSKAASRAEDEMEVDGVPVVVNTKRATLQQRKT